MKQIRALVKLVAAGIVSLVLLSAFCIVFSFSGVHVANPSGATDYKWQSRQWKSTMTEGFSWIKMDGRGFNNPDGVSAENPECLIMGSSHMEAVNVSSSENVAAQLRTLLPGMTVYNIGVSGHNIYTCAKNMKDAMSEYAPGKYVVVETDTVMLDSKTMTDVLENRFADIPSYDSGLLYYIQSYCPALKTIYKNIGDWRTAGKAAGSAEQSPFSVDKDVLERFLSKMKEDCGDRQLIILYQPATRIDGDGNFMESADGVKEFLDVCNRHGIVFVDMTADFRNLYQEQNILAHGFVNTAVGEGHLNRWGHRVIAEKLAEILGENRK